MEIEESSTQVLEGASNVDILGSENEGFPTEGRAGAKVLRKIRYGGI